MIDLDAIRRDNPLPEVAGRVVPLRRAGDEWSACCPFHRDRTPSFRIYDSGRRFHCFGCGATGDVLDFVQRAYGTSLPEAARLLGAGEVPLAPMPAGANCASPDNTGAKQAEARAIWQRAIPAAGTLAEAYLRWRGLLPPYPPSLRFLELACGNGPSMPCLVAAVQDATSVITGIQRIWLAPDGLGKADMAKPKLSLGRVRGGAIRLGDLDGGNTLTVCEGPEDGLSLAAMLGGPVWAAAGASFLPAMEFPQEVQSIVIGADGDPPGEAAAMKAAQAFAARGLSARILRPLPGFKDFNDELRGAVA
jgi:DNA primase